MSSFKWFDILVYQWWADLVSPYRVLFNFQKVPLVERGEPAVGFTIQISSSGNIQLQNAFLQSACFNRLPSSTAIDTNNRAAVELSTGVYLYSRDQILRSKLPSVTIPGLALFGFPSMSGLIENKFIVGMNLAFSPYFIRYSLYYSAVISEINSRLSSPLYSSSYNLFQMSLSGLLLASTVCEFAGAQLELWRLAADTCLPISNTILAHSCQPISKVFSYIRIFQLYWMSKRERERERVSKGNSSISVLRNKFP